MTDTDRIRQDDESIETGTGSLLRRIAERARGGLAGLRATVTRGYARLRTPTGIRQMFAAAIGVTAVLGLLANPLFFVPTIVLAVDYALWRWLDSSLLVDLVAPDTQSFVERGFRRATPGLMHDQWDRTA